MVKKKGGKAKAANYDEEEEEVKKDPKPVVVKVHRTVGARPEDKWDLIQDLDKDAVLWLNKHFFGFRFDVMH